jgi:hypothetical protein
MKTFLFTTLLSAIVLFNGCTKQNAFNKFNLSKEKELSEDTIETLKIKDANKTEGIVSVVYLNKVFPELYKDNEYFYIYYYLKQKDANITFLLNDKPSMLQEELPAQNRFSDLTSFNAPWSKYYIVGFKKEGNVLNLRVETDKAAGATLKFVKDK